MLIYKNPPEREKNEKVSSLFVNSLFAIDCVIDTFSKTTGGNVQKVDVITETMIQNSKVKN